MKWRTDIENAPKDKPILGYGIWGGEIHAPNGDCEMAVVTYVNHSDYPGFDWVIEGGDGYSSWLKLKAWANIADLPGSLFP